MKKCHVSGCRVSIPPYEDFCEFHRDFFFVRTENDRMVRLDTLFKELHAYFASPIVSLQKLKELGIKDIGPNL